VCRKFDISAADGPSLRFVLDSDGCELDADDFEYVLKPHISVLVLKPNEVWKEVSVLISN
jgi:hypothetical protein